MRERSLTSICACAASWVTFTDCTACRTECHASALDAPTPRLTPNPVWSLLTRYSSSSGVRTLPSSSNLRDRSASAALAPLSTPPPSPGSELVTCRSYRAPGGNTPSQSLSLLPGPLPWGKHDTGFALVPQSPPCQLPGSCHLVTSSMNIQGWQAPPSRVGFLSPCSNRALRAGQRVPLTRSVTPSVTVSSPAMEY